MPSSAIRAGLSGCMRAGIDLMQRPAVVYRCPALSYHNDLMKLKSHISHIEHFLDHVVRPLCPASWCDRFVGCRPLQKLMSKTCKIL